MTHFHFLAALLLAAALALPGQAQQYASTTDPVTGEVKQFHIFSACSELDGYCVEDVTRQSSVIPYRVMPLDMQSKLQQFNFVVVKKDTSQYYIRNDSTYRYLKATPNLGSLLHPVQFATIRSDTKAFTVTAIEGTDQVLLGIEGDDGVMRYLSANDSTTMGTPVLADAVKDSRFAWRIVEASIDPTAIRTLRGPAGRPVVRVEGRRILVGGDDSFQLFDLQGRRLNAALPQPPGIYMVHTHGGQSAKVVVR